MGGNQSAVYASNNEANESLMTKKSASNGANELFMPKKTGQMVIHFTAAWCGPCRAMEPIIHDFAAKYVGVEFIQIDVDESEGVAREYSVQALPAFVLIKKGKPVDKVVGADKTTLQKKIETYMRSNI